MIQEGFLDEGDRDGQKDILGRSKCEPCTAFSVSVLKLSWSRKALRTAIPISSLPLTRMFFVLFLVGSTPHAGMNSGF